MVTEATPRIKCQLCDSPPQLHNCQLPDDHSPGCRHAIPAAPAPIPGNPFTETVLRLIEADPHQWSARLCPTCSAVTAIANRPFGCIKKALK